MNVPFDGVATVPHLAMKYDSPMAPPLSGGGAIGVVHQKAVIPLGVPFPVGPSYPGTALHW